LALAGLNADLSSRLQQLRDAAQRDIGEAGRITSGFRTFEKQAALYAARGSNSNPVARPGFSEHEKGLAADVAGSDRFMQYVHAHAAEYGLSFPHANDPVHVQLANPRVDIRIDNPAGANVFTSTNSVGQAP
jgi:LAS superfamily LD-carboxypeptidase LdcB